jgi:hypothetical protein
MRTNANLFWLLTVFYIISAGGYALWGYLDNGTVEPIGFAAISMLVFMSGFIGFYIEKTARVQGPVPEDRLDANIEDGDAEIGFFAPWSWWPLALGLGCALAFTALAVGWWMFFIAVPLAVIAIVGFVFEHSRGHFAH